MALLLADRYLRYVGNNPLLFVSWLHESVQRRPWKMEDYQSLRQVKSFLLQLLVLFPPAIRNRFLLESSLRRKNMMAYVRNSYILSWKWMVFLANRISLLNSATLEEGWKGRVTQDSNPGQCNFATLAKCFSHSFGGAILEVIKYLLNSNQNLTNQNEMKF